MKRSVLLAIAIFVGLAVVFAALAATAKLFFPGDGFSQGLLLASKASAFGSGLAFFLIEVSSAALKQESEAKTLFEVESSRR